MSRMIRVSALRMSGASLRCQDRGDPEVQKSVLAELRSALERHRGYGIQLLVTPEAVEAMAQTNETAESVAQPGPVMETYMKFAREERCVVAGSIRLREDGRVYNSILYVGPSGEVLGRYHKANLTDSERQAGLASGPGAVVVNTPVGRIGGAVCFDLNFLPLRRAYAEMRPQIIVFPSMYHGGLAQEAWAYECRSYFISSHMGIECCVRDPFGRVIAETSHYYFLPFIADINLDFVMVHLDSCHQRLPEIKRKYGDDVTVDIPPNIGSILLAANAPDRTAADIAREYGLELLDDYFARNMRENAANRA